eukprot:15299187-Alexandrium_andersonii.AAC.1
MASGLVWRCPCGQENWNSRDKCRACRSFRVPDWQGWERKQHAHRKRNRGRSQHDDSRGEVKNPDAYQQLGLFDAIHRAASMARRATSPRREQRDSEAWGD